MKKLKTFSFTTPEKYKFKGSIYYHDCFYGTKAMRLLKSYNYYTYAEDDYAFTHANYDVIFAMIGEEPVGFICYWISDSEKKAGIMGSWVEPNWRYTQIRYSIYDKLFKTLVMKLEENKPLLLVSGTRNANVSVQKAFERQGRPITGYESALEIK